MGSLPCTVISDTYIPGNLIRSTSFSLVGNVSVVSSRSTSKIICVIHKARNFLFERSRCSVFLSDLARSKTGFCVFIIDDVLSISKDTQFKQRRMSRIG
jgi:hypothetical protein